jgi:hypothetical protein
VVEDAVKINNSGKFIFFITDRGRIVSTSICFY